jgi:MFS family permease
VFKKNYFYNLQLFFLHKQLGHKLVIFSLFIVLFIDGLGISIILPLFSEMFLIPNTSILPLNATLEMRNYIYAISLASFSLAMFLGSPVLGELSDKFGRKKIILLALWGTCVGYIISGIGVYVKWPVLFILGRILDGLTAGSIPIAQAAINDITPQKDRAGNLGLVLFAITSGYMIGPIISSFFSNAQAQTPSQLHVPFLATALLTFISIIFLIPFPNNFKKVSSNKINWIKSLNFIEILKKTTNVRIVVLTFLFFQLGWTMYFQYTPYFLSYMEMDSYISTFLASIGFGMVISFSLLVRLLQTKINSIQGVYISISSLALFTLLNLTCSNIVIMIVAVFLAAVSYALAYSFLLAYLSQQADPKIQGAIMGVAASMSALSAVISAMIGANLASSNPKLNYWSTIIFYVLSLLFLLFRKSRPKRH